MPIRSKQRWSQNQRQTERENFPNSGTRLWEQLLFMIATYIHVRLPCKFSPIWRIYLYIYIYVYTHKSRTKESLILERNWSSVMQRRVRERMREWKHPRLSSLYPRWAYRITISSPTDQSPPTRSSPVLARSGHVNLMMPRHKVWRLPPKRKTFPPWKRGKMMHSTMRLHLLV